MPGAPGIPENDFDVRSSQVFKALRKGSCVFSDGAESFQNVLKQDYPHLKWGGTVAHNQFQFTKNVRTPKGFSNVAGTQSLDRRWQWLDEFIPNQVVAKHSGQAINPILWEYVYAWVWRHNLPTGILLKHLGDVIRKTQ